MTAPLKLLIEKVTDLYDMSNKLSTIAVSHQEFIDDLGTTVAEHAAAITQLVEDHKRLADAVERIMTIVEMILPAGTDIPEPPPRRVLH